MSETKLLANFVKDGLYDQLFSSINEKFALEIIRPPQKVCEYMKFWGSKKAVESEAERQEFNRLFFEWWEMSCSLIKSKAVNLSQFLNVLPESPWKTAFIKGLTKEVDEAKRKK